MNFLLLFNPKHDAKVVGTSPNLGHQCALFISNLYRNFIYAGGKTYLATCVECVPLQNLLVTRTRTAWNTIKWYKMMIIAHWRMTRHKLQLLLCYCRVEMKKGDGSLLSRCTFADNRKSSTRRRMGMYDTRKQEIDNNQVFVYIFMLYKVPTPFPIYWYLIFLFTCAVITTMIMISWICFILR